MVCSFCRLLVNYLFESVIETKVVDLDSDHVIYILLKKFFIVIDFI